ncbi:MAG: hypothetical protein IJ588_06375 [Prevotella sp.]|nr:hypothetical protein [Prevotella sp.]
MALIRWVLPQPDGPKMKQTLQAVFEKAQPMDAIWEMEGEVRKRISNKKGG